MKILFIGGESSGKSTICEKLAEKNNWHNIPEYGRELFERKNGKLDYADMLDIGQTQKFMELAVEDVFKEDAIILCDTSPLVTKFYSLEWFGKVDPILDELSNQDYDIIFMCQRDFPYVNDGTRNGEEFSHKQELFYANNITDPYFMLGGSVEKRIETVERVVSNFKLAKKLISNANDKI